MTTVPARATAAKVKAGEAAVVKGEAHTLFGFIFRDSSVGTAATVKLLDGEKGSLLAAASYAAKGNATASFMTGVEVRSGSIYIEVSAGEVEYDVYWL